MSVGGYVDGRGVDGGGCGWAYERNYFTEMK